MSEDSKSENGDAEVHQCRRHFEIYRQIHRQPAHIHRTLALLYNIGRMQGYTRKRHGIIALERAVVGTIEHVSPFPVCIWRDMFDVLQGFMKNDRGLFSPALVSKACAALMNLRIIETGMAAQRMLEVRIRGMVYD